MQDALNFIMMIYAYIFYQANANLMKDAEINTV